MNKRDITGYENLEWNCGDNWAIPLPEFPVDEVLVFSRWFIPDETPVIPTGWIYQLARGEVVSECWSVGSATSNTLATGF